MANYYWKGHYNGSTTGRIDAPVLENQYYTPGNGYDGIWVSDSPSATITSNSYIPTKPAVNDAGTYTYYYTHYGWAIDNIITLPFNVKVLDRIINKIKIGHCGDLLFAGKDGYCLYNNPSWNTITYNYDTSVLTILGKKTNYNPNPYEHFYNYPNSILTSRGYTFSDYSSGGWNSNVYTRTYLPQSTYTLNIINSTTVTSTLTSNTSGIFSPITVGSYINLPVRPEWYTMNNYAHDLRVLVHDVSHDGKILYFGYNNTGEWNDARQWPINGTYTYTSSDSIRVEFTDDMHYYRKVGFLTGYANVEQVLESNRISTTVTTKEYSDKFIIYIKNIKFSVPTESYPSINNPVSTIYTENAEIEYCLYKDQSYIDIYVNLPTELSAVPTKQQIWLNNNAIQFRKYIRDPGTHSANGVSPPIASSPNLTLGTNSYRCTFSSTGGTEHLMVWTTTDGGNINPTTAPTINDDVFFTANGSYNVIIRGRFQYSDPDPTSNIDTSSVFDTAALTGETPKCNNLTVVNGSINLYPYVMDYYAIDNVKNCWSTSINNTDTITTYKSPYSGLLTVGGNLTFTPLSTIGTSWYIESQYNHLQIRLYGSNPCAITSPTQQVSWGGVSLFIGSTGETTSSPISKTVTLINSLMIYPSANDTNNTNWLHVYKYNNNYQISDYYTTVDTLERYTYDTGYSLETRYRVGTTHNTQSTYTATDVWHKLPSFELWGGNITLNINNNTLSVPTFSSRLSFNQYDSVTIDWGNGGSGAINITSSITTKQRTLYQVQYVNPFYAPDSYWTNQLRPTPLITWSDRSPTTITAGAGNTGRQTHVVGTSYFNPNYYLKFNLPTHNLTELNYGKLLLSYYTGSSVGDSPTYTHIYYTPFSGTGSVTGNYYTRSVNDVLAVPINLWNGQGMVNFDPSNPTFRRGLYSSASDQSISFSDFSYHNVMDNVINTTKRTLLTDNLNTQYNTNIYGTSQITKFKRMTFIRGMANNYYVTYQTLGDYYYTTTEYRYNAALHIPVNHTIALGDAGFNFRNAILKAYVNSNPTVVDAKNAIKTDLTGITPKASTKCFLWQWKYGTMSTLPTNLVDCSISGVSAIPGLDRIGVGGSPSYTVSGTNSYDFGFNSGDGNLSVTNTDLSLTFNTPITFSGTRYTVTTTSSLSGSRIELYPPINQGDLYLYSAPSGSKLWATAYGSTGYAFDYWSGTYTLYVNGYVSPQTNKFNPLMLIINQTTTLDANYKLAKSGAILFL